MITYEEAVDEIFSLFNEKWIDPVEGSEPIIGYVPSVQWDGVEVSATLDYAKYWARVSQQTVIEAQTTLRNGDCGQRYTSEGLVFVQLFLPKSDAQAMEKGRKLAIVARDVYRGKSTSGKVWFRNARINELPPEEKWYRFNIIAEYEYDEQQ
jgi:hypothetical protein